MINTPIRRYRRVNGVERYDVLDTAAAYRGTIDLRFGTDAGRFQKAMNLLLNNRPRYRVSRALPLRARPTRRALTEEEFDRLATLAGQRFVKDLFELARFQH